MVAARRRAQRSARSTSTRPRRTEVCAADRRRPASRPSSRPARANAASRRSVTSRPHAIRVGSTRNDATSNSGSPSIGLGSIATYRAGGEQVVVVEVAVHERARADVERVVERRASGPAASGAGLRPMRASAARGRRSTGTASGRAPEPSRHLHGDRVARPRRARPDQHRAARSRRSARRSLVAPSSRTAPSPAQSSSASASSSASSSVRRRHLQHGVVARRRDERVPGERERTRRARRPTRSATSCRDRGQRRVGGVASRHGPMRPKLTSRPRPTATRGSRSP